MNIKIISQTEQKLHIKFKPKAIWFQIAFAFFLIGTGIYSILFLIQSTPWPLCWIMGLTCIAGGFIILYFLQEIKLEADRSLDQMCWSRRPLFFRVKQDELRLKLSQIREIKVKIFTIISRNPVAYSFNVGFVLKDNRKIFIAKGALFTETSADFTRNLLNEWLHLV